jgi:hypothetical protein
MTVFRAAHGSGIVLATQYFRASIVSKKGIGGGF